MAYQRTIQPPDFVDPNVPRCIHFRSKAMYVTGEMDPQHIDEAHSHDQNCWCNSTQRTIGPDRDLVALDVCVAGRACYRAS